MDQQLTDSQLREKAGKLAHDFIIIDTHIDVPFRLQMNYEDVSKRTIRGHFDYDRAVQGGLNAAFMSIYVPAEYEKTGGGKKLADSLITVVRDIASKSPDKFAMAYSAEDIINNFRLHRFSLLLGIENGTALEGSIGNIQYFYDKGVRYITLTHSENNQICDASYDKARKWNGLSPFGARVIEEMNRLGMMIDVSHISDASFFDVISISKAPVIASHSSCRRFTPGWERNMNDEMIMAIAKNEGIIMINFGSSFINDRFRINSDGIWDQLNLFLKEHNAVFGDSTASVLVNDFFSNHSIKNATVSEVADHIDHVKKLVGIDYIGFGSDFDGVRFVPDGLSDVSMYPNLIYELLKRGYSDEEIEKICSKNFLRVWDDIEYVSRKLKNEQ